MTAFQFLRKLYPDYLFAAAFCIVSTFIAELTERSFLGLDFSWYRFVLRREQNAAAWFSSISMLYCGCTAGSGAQSTLEHCRNAAYLVDPGRGTSGFSDALDEILQNYELYRNRIMQFSEQHTW